MPPGGIEIRDNILVDDGLSGMEGSESLSQSRFATKSRERQGKKHFFLPWRPLRALREIPTWRGIESPLAF